MAEPLGPRLGVTHGSLTDLDTHLHHRRALFVTDAGVASAWPELFTARNVVVIGQGEDHKTFATLNRIYDAALAADLTRSDVIVGVGGGMVCDIAAFAASTWMRGCGLVLVPTTVLAQVDAAIGGKAAVNYGGIKNLVGSFYPAQTVLITPEVLTTLPDKFLVEGFAELLKHSVIADRDLFDTISTQLAEGSLLECVTAQLERAIAIKTTIVSADPTEQGQRMLLNFGHTLGHAIESVTGLRHGRAVAIGMVAAAELSVHRGRLDAAESTQLRQLLQAVELPTTLAEAGVTASRADLISAMGHDKKTHGDTVSIVLLDRIGSAKVVTCPYSVFEELVDAVA